MMQKKMQHDKCMHIYFYFYATTMNIPMGLHTTKLSTWGFRIYEAHKNIFILFL
jgi:hypothetical protein